MAFSQNRAITAVLVLLALLGCIFLGYSFARYETWVDITGQSVHSGRGLLVAEPKALQKESQGESQAVVKPKVTVQNNDADESWQKFVNRLPPNRTECNKLFEKSQYPRPFQAQFEQFKKRALEEQKKMGGSEGHIGGVPGQQKLYYHLANTDFVTTVCEIGFNFGHSAFFWLASTHTTMLYSFDIGLHTYTRGMAAYLKHQFQDRFSIILGDSRQTVPAFVKQRPNVKCDVLVVDGGHSYVMAKQDLENMKMLANMKNNIIIFDDYPSTMAHYLKELGRAWKEITQEGRIEGIYECSIANGGRGFTVGHYVS